LIDAWPDALQVHINHEFLPLQVVRALNSRNTHLTVLLIDKRPDAVRISYEQGGDLLLHSGCTLKEAVAVI